MLFFWLFLLFNGVLSLSIIRYVWKRRHLYRLGSSLPGPFALPIIGNGLKFLGKTEDILTIINKITKDCKGRPARLWLGPYLVIYFSDPEDIEKILSSTKITHKHDIYDIMKIYLGNGLITSSGYKWKLHRKIIQPMISIKFVAGYIDCFQKHVDICMEHLERHVNMDQFDIHDTLHNCFIDIIGDIILGTKIEAQKDKNHKYIQATIDMYEAAIERMMKPWLYPDLIYNLTKHILRQTRITSTLTAYYMQAIKNARERVKLQNGNECQKYYPYPIIDQIVNATEGNSIDFCDMDVVHHLSTLFNASEDTMTIIASFLCVFLGMYPQYQILAVNEIRAVLGETKGKITYEDIAKLSYLDMCVKETLRIVPIGPFIVRKTTENFKIGSKVYPKDCAFAIGIFEVHRSPKHWENPDTFFPDHFLPEAVEKRHPYAFIPFSAGPRNCIGKPVAYIGIKLMMANILQRFEIHAEGKMSDVELKSDISVRSKNGYKVQLRKRLWK